MSPPDANATGSSSTPPRANAVHTSTMKSTPNSRGAAVISSHINFLGADVDHLRPWLERDLEQAQLCQFDAMLSMFLQRASNAPQTEQPKLLQRCLETVVKLCNPLPPNEEESSKVHPAGEIKDALTRYVSRGIENAFYAPFTQAANIALSALSGLKVEGMRDANSELDIMFQQNDPKTMSQYHQDQQAIRKPDIVIIPFSYDAFPALKKQMTSQNQTNSRTIRLEKGQCKPDVALRWKGTLACIEFKRPTKKNLTPPKETYTLDKYVPTNPQYRVIEGLESNARATTETGQGISTTELRGSTGITHTTQNASGQSNKRKADEPAEPSGSKRAKIKAGSTERKLDVIVQTGLYAAEMFAANIAVKRVINLIVVHDQLWIWYYDRQGTIQSSGINFIQDLPRFLVLLYALQRFSLDDWGRNTEFKPLSDEEDSHKPPSDEKNVRHKITISDDRLGIVDLELHTGEDDKDQVKNYGLKGRATNVFDVTSKRLAEEFPHAQKDGMVAKIFWGEQQRTSEPDILKKVAEIAAKKNSVKGHVPDLLWSHKFVEPTSEVREQLGIPEPTKGSRVLYILVFRKLQPITKLHGKRFFDVWKQCILCHFDLWQGGVYHRDVSPANMMWYEKDGILMGVLNDYDLSSLASAHGPQGNERTGTVPFMALDLLTPKGQGGEVKHLYRHDLESFIWVLVWVCLRYKDGTLLQFNRPFDDWATKDAVTVGEKKAFFLINFLAFQPKDLDPLMWSLVVRCVEVLDAESHRRRRLLVNLNQAPELGKDTSGSRDEPDEETAESDEETSDSGEETSKSRVETSGEEADIELADDVVLRTFRKTEPWIKLTRLIKRSNKKSN